MLKRLKEEGITILVSTPYMDEANLCDRIALIQEGKIMSINTPAAIIKEFPEELFAIRSENMGQLLQVLRNSALVKSCNAFGDFHHVTFKSEDADATQKLEDYLKDLDFKKVEIKVAEPSIEDCFIKLMNENERSDTDK